MIQEKYLNILGIKPENGLDCVDWYYISRYQKLSEDFIREFQDRVNWVSISISQTLSENFIRELENRIDWHDISIYQTLSENFIREFKNYVNWINISIYQKLSEDFIREFQDRVNWVSISISQTLSENFIREFKDKVKWYEISKFQTLSENFIREFKYYVYWNDISDYQKLSDSFIQEFKLNVDKDKNWLYWSKENKLQAIKNCGLYEIDGDYIIAYKATRTNGLSVYNSQYQYAVGNIYTSNCDCNIYHDNSFGLSAWTKEKALEYYSRGELYKVKIHIDDVGALVHDGGKLRCFKLEILERIQ